MGDLFESKDRTGEFDSADIQSASAISGVSYFFILFFLPLITNPGSSFGKFHANQSLMLLISGVVVSILRGILSLLGSIPIIGVVFGIVGWIVSLVLGIMIFAFMIMGMVNAFSGKAKEIPVIGKFVLIK